MILHKNIYIYTFLELLTYMSVYVIKSSEIHTQCLERIFFFAVKNNDTSMNSPGIFSQQIFHIRLSIWYMSRQILHSFSVNSLPKWSNEIIWKYDQLCHDHFRSLSHDLQEKTNQGVIIRIGLKPSMPFGEYPESEQKVINRSSVFEYSAQIHPTLFSNNIFCTCSSELTGSYTLYVRTEHSTVSINYSAKKWRNSIFTSKQI